jgi:hypothetical protein
MDSFATLLGAMLGLMLNIGPAAIAQAFPRIPDLKLLPVCVLGALSSAQALACGTRSAAERRDW